MLTTTVLEKALQFFENYTGENAVSFIALPQSGSARVNYIAESTEEKYVVTFNDNIRENQSFFYFTEIFSSLNLNTPKIYAISEDRKTYIQEYLGAETLSQIIEKEGISQRVHSLVMKTLDHLYKLQKETLGKIDYTHTFEYEEYDELPMLNDLFYFKKMFVDILEIHYHKSSLLKEFKKIVQKIENLKPKGLMIRDFQARNIMVNQNDEVSFIDYQSAMKGPLIYDVVSFLFQAKANFSDDFKNEMLEYYIDKFDEEDKKELRSAIQPVQLLRFMQVLGAYGFRGLIQRKSHFISSIEKGVENLVNFSDNWAQINEFPELKTVIRKLQSEESKQKIAEFLKK